METNAALEGAADIGMLDTIALEDADGAVIHFNRQVDLGFPLGIFQDIEHSSADVADLHGLIHGIDYVLIRIVFFTADRHCCSPFQVLRANLVCILKLQQTKVNELDRKA